MDLLKSWFYQIMSDLELFYFLQEMDFKVD